MKSGCLTSGGLHARLHDPELDRLLVPSSYYAHPQEVLDDDALSVQEKRAILASWVSDACSVPSRPCLRQPPGFPAPVGFDDIMDALRSLDYRACAGRGIDRRAPSPTCEA
jgi:hypothetical protein